MPSLFCQTSLSLFQNQFIPDGSCLLWKPELISLHGIGDLLIAFACYSIPIVLIYLASKRAELFSPRVFLTLGAFLVACGTTHLLEIWALWHPNYWLAGFLKVVTAGVLLYTVIGLIFLTPKVLALPGSAQLE
jgi:hypothetical protein